MFNKHHPSIAEIKNELSELTLKVNELEESLKREMEQQPLLVHEIRVWACCGTCRKFDKRTDTCSVTKTHIPFSLAQVCKDKGYDCDPAAINAIVKEALENL